MDKEVSKAKIKERNITILTGILSIAWLESIALFLGYDGYLFISSISVISGIIGYLFPRRRSSKK